jgi:excisionase family DNA binding protein
MTEDDLNQLFPARAASMAAPVHLVLTVEQAAERRGIGRTVMYALVSSGAVESVQIGRLRLVPADALVTFLDELRAGRRGGAARNANPTDAQRSTRAAMVTGTVG